MIIVERNAIVCPRCGRRIPGIRIAEDTVFRRLSVHCKRCDLTFMADYQPRPELLESQRH